MDEWEEFVVPHFDEVVKYLKPAEVMDSLRARGLVNRDEYTYLQTLQTEKSRSQKLLNDYLPTKGPGSFRTFCDILHSFSDQRIVADVICRPICLHGSAATTAGHQTLEASRNSTLPIESSDVCPAAKRTKLDGSNSATFFFKPEHRNLLGPPIRSVISDMCQEAFGDGQTVPVMFVSADMSAVKALLESWGPCYVDLDAKLAVLFVYGVVPEQVEKHRKNLEHKPKEFKI